MAGPTKMQRIPVIMQPASPPAMSIILFKMIWRRLTLLILVVSTVYVPRCSTNCFLPSKFWDLASFICTTTPISMNLSRSSAGYGSLSGMLINTSSTHSRHTYSTKSSSSATTVTPSMTRPFAFSSRIHTPVTK